MNITPKQLFEAYQRLGSITAVAEHYQTSYSSVQRKLVNYPLYRLEQDSRTVAYLDGFSRYGNLTTVADDFDVTRQAVHQVIGRDPSYRAIRAIQKVDDLKLKRVRA